MSVYQQFLFMVLVLCVPTLARANIVTGCAENYDPNMDYFPNKISLSHAEDFSVTYYKNYKIVQNTRTHETFALYQCGTPAPSGLTNTTKVFAVPFSKIAITSTVEITLLELLGLRTSIKYISDPQYVTSPCIQNMVVNNVVQSLSSNATLREEQLKNVDAVFEFSTDPSNNKSVSVSTSQDPGTLHRSGWIGFMAAFFNQEAKAMEVLTLITNRYNCVQGIAQGLPSRPKVAWVDYYITYQIDVADYKQEYITDLGATPIAPLVNRFTSVSDWKAAVADADIVIDQTYLGDMDSFYATFNLSSTSTEYKFIKNGQVWRFDKLQSDFGGLDWFEGAVPNADAVLEDLLTIVKPEARFPHTRIWFRNSFINEPVVIEGSGKCADYSQPAPLRSDECVAPSPTPTPTSDGIKASSCLFAILVAAPLAMILAIF